ncbi:MAG: putative zinc-binding metallopeptidase [Gammaproteobacteria bacterium]|nr:putative zinc-binding metallopeptidase [Gammaproteobacteria bacterium]
MARRIKRTRRRRKKNDWIGLNDADLLDLRFSDLRLTLESSPVAERIAQLYDELARRNIRFRPHCWLAEEWFSPDGVPGFAIPFYLAHPRLAKLEYRQMFDIEGGAPPHCMQLLRHETGHAIMTAFRLHRRAICRTIFGRFSRPYPRYYTPRPESRHFVLHLDRWYAQSHPAEDFAETFAVWLSAANQWQREYWGWPALRKLQVMDQLMSSIARRWPPVKTREKVEPLAGLRKTLREHYEEKRAHYGIKVPAIYDADLLRVFARMKPDGGQRTTAASFLRRISPRLCRACARGTGEHPYTVAQIVKEMIFRCRKLRLYLDRTDQATYMEVAVFVSVLLLNYLHRIRHRIPV